MSILIREWQPEDTEALIGWLKDEPQALADLGLNGATPAMAVLEAAVRAVTDPTIRWFAADSDDNLAALIVATDYGAHDGSAVVHIAVFPEHRGKGVWIERKAARYAYEQLGLRKLYGLVPKGNDLAKRVNEAVGFEDMNEKQHHMVLDLQARFGDAGTD